MRRPGIATREQLSLSLTRESLQAATKTQHSQKLNTVPCFPIQIIGIPEKEEKKKGYEKIFEEIIVENFLNMEK